MSRIFSIFVFCFSLTILSACASFSLEEQHDHDFCVQIVGTAVTGWKDTALEEIYNRASVKKGDQKSHLYALDQVLKECSLKLSVQYPFQFKHYDVEIDAMRALGNRIETFYSAQEKPLFMSRTGGKPLCGQDESASSMRNFLYWPMPTPRENCLYTIPQTTYATTVFQTSSNAILVGARGSVENIIALRRDNEKEDKLVDGAPIQAGYFSYEGVYRYQSLTGERSVYSFRRIADPFADIVFYNGR